MPWACAAGETLLIPSGPLGSHLFVILNNPKNFETYPPQSCVLVDFCTIRSAPYDNTRSLNPGVHPFVVAPSYVNYRHARMDSADHLMSQVKANYFVSHTPVNGELLKTIISGLYDSPQTPRYLKKLGIP